MGYLRNILMALGALAAAEVGLTTGWLLPGFVPILVGTPYLFARVGRALGERGGFRASGLMVGALGWCAPAVQLGACALLGWSDAVNELWGARLSPAAWPGPELLFALLPYACTELAAIDAGVRLRDQRADVRAGLRRFQTRMLLSSLAPLIVFVTIAGLVALDPTVQAYVEEVSLVNALVTGLLLGIFALGLPRLLRSAWDTAPLESGMQRAVLEDTARRADFRCGQLRVWRTSNLMANAAVVGLIPQHRVVLFSDALLASLGLRELAAVFAHEIGHVRRRHVWVFGAWALGLFLSAGIVLRRLELGDPVVELGLLLGLLILWYLSFGYLSRRFELDADLEGVAIMGGAQGLIDALELLGGARERSTWRHFSVADRVRFLDANREDPGVGRRLRRRLRRWSLAGVGLFCAALVVQGWELTEALPRDRVVVDLRLGRFEQAGERARRLELDERLLGAVDAAAALPAHAQDDSALIIALGRLQGGDIRVALGLLDIVALRGAAAVPEGLREALARALEGEAEPARELIPQLAPAWRAALRGALAKVDPPIGQDA